jgi:hypothetical protein
MMTYTAPDGHVIESQPYPQEVTYSCPCEGIVDGVYFSMETTGAATPIGIQQIRINRVVNNNNMTLTIRESSEQELQDYINNLTLI